MSINPQRLILSCAAFACVSLLQAKIIADYRACFGITQSDPTHRIVLRSFLSDGQRQLLLADPDTLLTSIQSANRTAYVERPWTEIRWAFHNSPYVKALLDAEANSRPVQDAGITRFQPHLGIDLTVDLCPSRRPLDRELFDALVGEIAKRQRPVPLGVSLTGVWMKTHPEDLRWLQDLERQGAIAVTWINHSFNHRISRERPLGENFLLAPGTDIASEILHTEALMIEKGITPSLFFRFPGLVSAEALFLAVTGFGLIPLGSDAWLAKNQWPRPGSIVLVHANGNEPLGVRRFIRLLKEKRQEILNQKWFLFDLRESVQEEKKRSPDHHSLGRENGKTV